MVSLQQKKRKKAYYPLIYQIYQFLLQEQYIFDLLFSLFLKKSINTLKQSNKKTNLFSVNILYHIRMLNEAGDYQFAQLVDIHYGAKII